MPNKAADKTLIKELRTITKDKAQWNTAIDDVAAKLGDRYSAAVKAKALWFLGEMGLQYPLQVQPYLEQIAGYLTDDNPKLRARSVNALGRIGRADKALILPYFEALLKMYSDTAETVRLAFVWACENIATNAPELFCGKLEMFYELISDRSERVRIEAPEIFRVMGKRLPHSVEPYLKKLERFAEYDVHPVVRIHSGGAIRITKQALEKGKNAANE
ncbi:sister chromatid cohesion protein PDS5 [Treponema socranskii]|uniref:sister chromatid cohesion protein PDS5 n=1 Tax=Treponema socranskii TaxID=53419 RepID=UPI0028E2EB5F|nr:sister chromatid cohesion protein PDS5 [Treponema socranskii]